MTLAESAAPRVPSLAGLPSRTADPRSDLRDKQQSFLSVLGRANLHHLDPPAQAHEAAKQFVADTFVLPLLKQLRSMENAAPPFAPGPGERQFRALSDADLAQRIMSARRFPLVDRVARQLLAKGGHATEVAATRATDLAAAHPPDITQVLSPAAKSVLPGTRSSDR
jgi:Rod binding domain-containing protein